MAVPSIKSLIVDALTGKVSIDRVHRQFFIEQFIKVYKPRNLRGLPNYAASLADVKQAMARLGVTEQHLIQWEELWTETVHACQKRAKLRSMNEVSIENLLKSKLSGTGIKYQLKKQQYRVALTLSMSHNTQATFYILHSKFREQLDKVLPSVIQLNQLMDELGQGIRIRAFNKREHWIEVDS